MPTATASRVEIHLRGLGLIPAFAAGPRVGWNSADGRPGWRKRCVSRHIVLMQWYASEVLEYAKLSST